MIAYSPAGQERSGTTDVEPAIRAVRPADCSCEEFHGFADLPCWPCYREGFETVADR